MDLQSRKIEFVQEFLKLQSEEVISRLEKILWNETLTSTEKEVEPMTVQEFNDRIDQSMEDSKNGRLIKASDLKAKIEKWG
jgi:hypothetical protein